MSKFFKYKISEFYFLIITLLYWMDVSIILNPIAIFSSVLLLYLVLKQYKVIGLIYGGILLLLTIYLFFAFLSDFHKIIEFNLKNKNFIIYGSSLLIVNFIMSLFMIYKYSNLNLNEEHNKVALKYNKVHFYIISKTNLYS